MSDQRRKEAADIALGARAFRFTDGRRGLLSPFGIDKAGVYEITDSTRALAVQYAEAGLIEVHHDEIPTASTAKDLVPDVLDEEDEQ